MISCLDISMAWYEKTIGDTAKQCTVMFRKESTPYTPCSARMGGWISMRLPPLDRKFCWLQDRCLDLDTRLLLHYIIGDLKNVQKSPFLFRYFNRISSASAVG